MENITFTQYLEKIQTTFLTGDYTKCWSYWGYKNIRTSYDKFYFILDGECLIEIDDKKYLARKGQLFLLPYNSLQTYHHISDNHISKYWLHFNATCNDMDLLELISLPHYIEVKDADYVTWLFKNIISLSNIYTINSLLMQKSYILQLVSYYIDNSNLATKNIFKDNRLSELFSYIDANLHNDITLNQLCNIMHLHPNYFIRYFKKRTGVPPMEYINDLRIAKAKKILQIDNMPIQEVATSVGFNNAYYFSRIFKKKTGFSPSSYRQIANSKPDNYDFD